MSWPPRRARRSFLSELRLSTHESKCPRKKSLTHDDEAQRLDDNFGVEASAAWMPSAQTHTPNASRESLPM
jgi:hypothetical protein